MRTIYSLIFVSTLILAAGFIGLSIPENNIIANACTIGVMACVLGIALLLVFIKDIKEYKNKKKNI